MESRIAILGSCITRDLWPVRGAPGRKPAYVSRTSFPTLLSPPVPGFVARAAPPGDLTVYEYAAVVAEIRKTALADLVAYRPTHLIIDLIDERFDLLSVGDSLVSLSGELVRSGHLVETPLKAGRRVRRLSEACDRLWAEAAGEFAALLRATPLREARLILHSARWATHYRSPKGGRAAITGVEIVAGQAVAIPDYNGLLERQERILEALFPPMARVEAGRHRLADPGHRWGPSPFHYIPEYYAEISRQLAGQGVEISGSRVAPSALAV
jgi:hypothetical protein